MKKLLILLTFAVSGAMARPGFKSMQPQSSPVMPSVVYAHQQPQVQPQQSIYHVPAQPQQQVVMPMVHQVPVQQPMMIQQPMQHMPAHPQQVMMQQVPVQQPAMLHQAPMVVHNPQPQPVAVPVLHQVSHPQHEDHHESAQEGEPVVDTNKLMEKALRHNRAKVDDDKLSPELKNKIADQENEYQYTVDRTREVFLKLRSLMQRTLETVNESLRSLNDMVL